MRRTYLLCLTISIMLASCSPVSKPGGHLHEPLSWKGITPGITTEDQVLSILGAPSDIYDSDGEYYYEYQLEGLDSDHYHRIYFRYRLFKPRMVSWLDLE